MIGVALRGLAGRKLRTVLTALSIVLGTAMIAGTFVLRDQIRSAYGTVFDQSNKGTDVVLQKKTAFTGDFGAEAGPLPASLIDTVRGVPGVAKAEGQIQADGTILLERGADSHTSVFVLSTVSNPFGEAVGYRSGGAPTASGQVAVNRKLAEDKGIAVGDSVLLSTEVGLRQVSVSGIFDFAGKSSLGGSDIAVTTFADAQSWFDRRGKTSTIMVDAAPGVSAGELVKRIQGAVPSSVDVQTGAQNATHQADQASSGITDFLTPLLLAFAGTAVFVGAFIIFNTFSITVAQRTREYAMLRTIGGSRRQVLVSVLVEAIAIGLVASAIGIVAGIGFAALLDWAFGALGAELPSASIHVAPIAVLLPLGVGTSIALLSSIGPALRATRVPPIAALREGAEIPPGRFSRFTPWLGGLLGVGGMLLLVQGIFGGGSTSAVLLSMAAGAMLVFIAVAMLSRYIVRPLARVIGWPVERLSNTSGRLARENALRNPSRTATTAAALMIGVGLVVFVGVFVNGFKESFLGTLDDSVTSDLIVQSDNGMIPSRATGVAAGVPGVQTATGIQFTNARIGKGGLDEINGIDPRTFGALYEFDWKDGSNALLSRLGPNDALVEQDFAKSHDLVVGQRFSVTSSENVTMRLRVAGVYHDPVLMTGFTVPSTTYDRFTSQHDLGVLLVGFTPGTDVDQGKAAVAKALESFPTAAVRTNAEYKAHIGHMVNQFLALLYVLLAMSVVISLFGIVNTLALSVFERTREIGMLRAIGMTRRQLRRVVRYESLITAVMGGILGVAIGVLFGWMVAKGLEDQGGVFAPPYTQLVVSVVVAGLAGIVAAILPARRAARLDVLEALQYE